MLHLAFKVLISVRSKLFFSFLAMSLLIALLGGYAVLSVQQAGRVVEDTFDRPLMAINFARSASQTFTEIELDLLAGDVDERRMDSAITRLEDFRADLAIARERSIAPRATTFFDDAQSALIAFEALLQSPDTLSSAESRTALLALGDDVETALDIIVELQTNESFRARERAIESMQSVSRYALFALGAALLLTLILSSWLAITIINPLKAAASAARKISAGKLDVDIPPGGDDETGVLLKTMGLMQDNIRSRMARESDMRTLAQDRLAQSLENSKDAILLTDASGKIIVANARIGHLFAALAGRDLRGTPFAAAFQPDGLPLEQGCVRYGDEIACPDGRWARVNASVTQEGGHLFIWTDITEDKQKSERLEQAKQAAEAANAAKTVFLAAMSHELRTPLNAVIGFSDILAREQFGALGNPDYVDMATHISRSGAHLLNIVTDVLDIADGRDPETLRTQYMPIDLRDAGRFAARTLKFEADTREITLDTNLGRHELPVLGDGARLQQLLVNLVGNAVKFNRDGGRIVLTARRAPGWVMLDVSDTGIGLSAEDADAVFKPFSQVDAGHSRAYEGVGLGLTIARKIAREHGGDLRIASVLGQGTTVRLALPERQTEPQTLPVRKADAA